MMRTLLGTCLAISFALASTAAAQANWPPRWTTGYYYSSYDYYAVPAVRSYYYAPVYYAPAYYTPVYYAPAPVYVAPAPPYCPTSVVQPVPVYGPGYANPTPAPPSQTKEPPTAISAGPSVTESRTITVDGGAASKVAITGTKDTVKVGFWNVSGAAVKAIVDGKTYTIPSNNNLTLTLNREFTYQIDAQAPRTERVPDDKTGHEIVIR
jgi:hypothetical protein